MEMNEQDYRIEKNGIATTGEHKTVVLSIRPDCSHQQHLSTLAMPPSLNAKF